MANVDVVVAVAEFTARTTTGTLDVTSTLLDGRQPKAAIVILTRHNASSDPNPTSHAVMSIGFTDGVTSLIASSTSVSAQSQTVVDRNQGTGLLIQTLGGSANNLTQATFSSWVTNGIRLNFTTVESPGTRGIVILFAGNDLEANCNIRALGTGTSALTVSGVGFNPDIVFACSAFAAGATAVEDFFSLGFGIGVNDGVPTQMYMGMGEVNAVVAGGNPTQVIRDNCVMGQVDAGSSSEAYLLTLGGFGSDGFTITPSASANNDDFQFLALKLNGAAFKLFSINTKTTTTGNVSYTVPGFRPQAAIWVGCGLESRNTVVFDAAPAGGFALGALSNDGKYCAGIRLDPVADPTATESLVISTSPIRAPTGASLSAVTADFVSWNSTGFTLNWTAVASVAKMGFALAIKQQQMLLPSLVVPEDDGFFTPQINQRILPGFYSDAAAVETSYTHIISRLTLLSPALYTDTAENFYTPSVIGEQMLLPTSEVASDDAFFVPIVSLPPATLHPALYDEGDSIFGATIDNPFTNIVTKKIGLIHIVELDIFQRSSTSQVIQWIWPFGYYAFSTVPQEALPVSGVQTLRYSDVGYKTPLTGTYANTLFSGQVEQPLRLTRSIPVVPESARRVNLEIGAIEIINEEGEFDELPIQYAIDGRQVQVKIGLNDYTYDEFMPVFIGRAVAWTATISTLFVEVRDQTYQLDKPLQLTLYAGTGGAEGTLENEGKPKPKSFGAVKNITPVLIDPANLVYQFHDRAAQFVNEIYDQGAFLTRTGDDYATYVLLVAATIAPGKFATCLAFGLFRLGSSPAGLITCDVKGDAAGGYIDIPGDIAKRIMKDFGNLGDSDFDASSWAAFTADVTGSIGIYFDSPILISDAVSAIMGACAAWWGASITGKFQAQRLAVPNEANVVKAFSEYDVIDMERVQPPPGAFPPRHRQRVGYRRNWTIQRGEDLAGSVDEERRQFLRDEYRVVSTFDDNVRQEYFLSTNPEMLGSLFTGEDNRLSWSQDYSQSVWTKTAITILSSTILAPDNTSTATEFRETAVTSSHDLRYDFTPSYLAPDNTDFTISFLVKKATGSRDWCQLHAVNKAGTHIWQNFNLNSGAKGASGGLPGDALAIDEGKGWYRIKFWMNTGVGATVPFASVHIATSDGGLAPSYAGSTAQGMYVWGAQVEIGRELSNYWKTLATRSINAKQSAENLSADLMTLLKVVRETVRITVDLEGHLATVGATVQLTHQRVNAGQLWVARVIDMTLNSAERTVDLVLWG